MARGSQAWLSLGLILIGILAAGAEAAAAAEKNAGGPAAPNPFFAYCVGIGTTPQDGALQAQLELPAMLAELGYSGMAYVGLDGAGEMLQALEKHGQKLFAVYAPLNVDPGERGYDQRLQEIIPRLKGHGTIVWLTVNSKRYKPSTTDGDQRAVALLREIADTARRFDVAISLYPHKGIYAERMEDVVRLARKTDRPNVGVTFTFCHFLAVDDAKNLDRVLAMAGPWLNMVTINGTSGYDPKHLGTWIQVLGEGSFDVRVVLESLRKLQYRGPIGMIAFGIKGDRREILRRSIEAWKRLSANAVPRKGE